MTVPTGIRLLKVLPVENSLGEGVTWDDRIGAFYWTDILERRLSRYTLEADQLEVWETPERLASFGFVEGDADLLIAAFESGFAEYRFETGEVEWIARPEAGVTGTRFNDGRVDRQGRFWAGTMVEGGRAVDAEGREVDAALYRVERGVCTRMETGVRISNSLAWSGDSRVQYFADSPRRVIYRYDFDPGTGSIGNRRTFAEVAPPAEPDGSTVDAENHLWSAEWRGSKAVRYRPDGGIDFALELPVFQPTCVAFGGPELNLLAVTTAAVELSEKERGGEVRAGSLLLFETPYRGLAEARYQR